MERKIGEIFEYNGEWYQVVECDSCGECSLRATECGSGTKSDLADEVFGECSKVRRSDSRHAIFKKLEKVGEPCTHYCPSGRIIYFQGYKLFHKLYSHNTEYIMCDFNEDGIVSIEIKQNKEDMEEKTIKIKKEDIEIGNKVICLSNSKPYVIIEANCRMKYDGDWHDCVIYTPLYDNPYKCFVRPIKDFAQNFVLDSAEEKEEKHSNLESTGKNLKPFNLEAAKAGKPVCTRDGRKARIICFDAEGNKPLIVLSKIDGKEVILRYTEKGQSDNFHSPTPREDDLMMLPEKKEGWVNVYYNKIDGITFSKHPHTSKEEAIKEAGGTLSGRIDTVKISWEE